MAVRGDPRRPPEILYVPLFNSSFSGETTLDRERSGRWPSDRALPWIRCDGKFVLSPEDIVAAYPQVKGTG
jgi:hypothetical protein